MLKHIKIWGFFYWNESILQNESDINLRDLGQKYYGLNICCLPENVCDCVYFIIYSHIIHTPLASKMTHGISFLFRVTDASSTTEGYPNLDDPRHIITLLHYVH